MKLLTIPSVFCLGLFLSSCITTNSEMESSSQALVSSSLVGDKSVSSSFKLSSILHLDLSSSSETPQSVTQLDYSSQLIISSGGSSSEVLSSIEVSSSSYVSVWDTVKFTDTLSVEVKDSLRATFMELVNEAMDSNKTFENDLSMGPYPQYENANDPLLDSLWNAYPGLRTLCLKNESYEMMKTNRQELGEIDSLFFLNNGVVEYQEIKAFEMGHWIDRMFEVEVDENSCETDEYFFQEFKSTHPYATDSVRIERKIDNRFIVMKSSSGLV